MGQKIPLEENHPQGNTPQLRHGTCCTQSTPRILNFSVPFGAGCSLLSPNFCSTDLPHSRVAPVTRRRVSPFQCFGENVFCVEIWLPRIFRWKFFSQLQYLRAQILTRVGNLSYTCWVKRRRAVCLVGEGASAKTLNLQRCLRWIKRRHWIRVKPRSWRLWMNWMHFVSRSKSRFLGAQWRLFVQVWCALFYGNEPKNLSVENTSRDLSHNTYCAKSDRATKMSRCSAVFSLISLARKTYGIGREKMCRSAGGSRAPRVEGSRRPLPSRTRYTSRGFYWRRPADPRSVGLVKKLRFRLTPS